MIDNGKAEEYRINDKCDTAGVGEISFSIAQSGKCLYCCAETDISINNGGSISYSVEMGLVIQPAVRFAK